MAGFADLIPSIGAFAIVPHDTNALPSVPRAIYIGTAGNVKVTMSNGSTVTFVGVTAGSLLPIRPRIVWSAGTTATDLVGLY